MENGNMGKRHGKLELSKQGSNGKRVKMELGAVFEGKFQGNYGVSLTLPRKDENGNVIIGENGYPEREKIVAVKGEYGQKLIISDCFINFLCYEEMSARPPYDGPGADDTPAPKKEEFSDEDF